MKTERIVPAEERRVGREGAMKAVRQALTEADARRVSVSDVHGHTIIEVPVERDQVGLVMEPVLAATKAVADTVGEVVLRVEKEQGLPAEGGTGRVARPGR